MGRMMVTAVAAALCTLVILAGNASAVGPGKTLTWSGGGKGKVVVDGRKHSENEKGRDCKDCHHGLFSMKYGTAKITHAELKQGHYCGACHNGTLAFSTVDEGKCFACHQGKKKKPGR